MKSRNSLRFITTIVLATVLLCTLATDAANRGVFIGTSEYGGYNSLPDTEFDASDMRNTFVREGVVTKDNAALLTGYNTKERILRTITDQARGLGPGDILYIHNASHGSRGGMCASDANITPDELSAVLNTSFVGAVVLMNDSCHSESFHLNLPWKQVVQINAAGTDNVAYSSTAPIEGMGHVNGVLTKFIIDGISDGTADINRDGRLTTKELIAWVRTNSRNERNYPSQHNYDNNITGQNVNGFGQEFEIRRSDPDKSFKDKRLIPNVVGLELAEALDRLKKDDLKGTESQVEILSPDWVDGQLAGKVKRQYPYERVKVDPGSEVKVDYYATKVVTVPNMIGMSLEDAEKNLAKSGLKMSKSFSREGRNVSGQVPIPGKIVVEGSCVTVSEGTPGNVEIPNLVKLDRITAENLLKQLELTSSVSVEKRMDKLPFTWSGKVWKSLPVAGEYVAKGSNVRLTVAPENPVDVPYLMDMTEANARKKLREVGLGMLVVGANCRQSKTPCGVYDWNPQPQAYKGDTIHVSIEYPEVPNLNGKTVQEATDLCKAAKLALKVEKKEIPAAADFNKIAAQNPAAGTRAQPGDAVTGFQPVPVAKLTVKAIDKQAKTPIKGATIFMTAPRAQNAPAPDGMGTFIGLVKGTYTVTATKKGYVTGKTDIAIDPDKSLTAAAELALDYDQAEAREVLHVTVTDLDKKPGKDFDFGAQFIGQVDPSDIPADAKIGQVEWIIVSPGGGRIPLTDQDGGTESLSTSIKPSKDWQQGEYGLIAIVHTEAHGIMSGQASFKLLPSKYIVAKIKLPCRTGQWSIVQITGDLPFKIGDDPENVRLQGLGKYSDPKYWSISGRTISFRPVAPGQQQPAFKIMYKDQEAGCRGTVNVKLTEMKVDIDLDKKQKKNGKEIINFSLTLPGSFEQPFAIDVKPADGIEISNKPKKYGRSFTIKGYMIPGDISDKTKDVVVNLIDKTDAVALGIIDISNDCECLNPPAQILRIIRKFQNSGQLVQQMESMKNDEARAKMFAVQSVNELAMMYDWIGGLKNCRHLSSKARSVFTRMAMILRKAPKGDKLSDAESKALFQEGLAVSRDARSMGPSDIKPGFMKTIIKR